MKRREYEALQELFSAIFHQPDSSQWKGTDRFTAGFQYAVNNCRCALLNYYHDHFEDEAERREHGCSFCRGEKPMGVSNGMDDEGEHLIGYVKISRLFEAKYCPVCGKRLEVNEDV